MKTIQTNGHSAASKLRSLFGRGLLALLAAGLLFSSCTNVLNDPAPDGVTVSVAISANEDPLLARTIAPSQNQPVALYRLFGAPEGQSETLLAEFASLGLSSKVNLEPGSWNFTMKALDGNGDLLLEGALAAISLVADRPASLHFVLTVLGAGTGSVEVDISWPASVAVASIVPILAGVELDAVDVTGLQSWTFTRSLEKGGYLLSFSLRDVNGLETALIPEFLKVYPNLASCASFTLAAGDFNTPPQAPTGIAVLPVANLDDASEADVSITWTDASTNEAGFEIEYADDGVNWQSAGDAIAAASETFPASLARGATRQYRVRAVNRFGPSDWATSGAYTAPWLVSFEVNGGNSISAQEIAPGALASEPATPVKYGSLFGGWYTDDADFANAFDFGADAVATSITLYAKWTKALILDPGRGEGERIILNWADGTTDALPANTFTRAGYTFVGWSRQELGAVHFTEGASYTMADGDTLYARWTRSDASPANTFTTANYGDGLVITKYTGSLANVIVPDMKDGKPIVRIAGTTSSTSGNGFSSRSNISSIELPETLQSIGPYSFYNCDGLTSIVIPEGVTSIDGDANSYYASYNGFFGSNNLSSVSLPSTLTHLTWLAFSGCTNLASINLENTKLVEIDQQVFYNCTSLTSITIPNTVATIRNSAFYSCTTLSSVSLPDSLLIIEASAFYNCQWLVDINLPASLTHIGDNAFFQCYRMALSELPASLVAIGNRAFYHCNTIFSLVVPASVTQLGSEAFSICNNLKNVSIAGNITEIGYQAFRNNPKLETVVITGNVKRLGSSGTSGVFQGCTALKSVDLGPTMEVIGRDSFNGCDALQTVIVPDTLQSIGSYAFNSAGLRTFNMPPSVNSIGTYAFANCFDLSRVTLGLAITTIPESAFRWCRSLEEIYIPQGVTSIAQYAFAECDILRSVDLPEGLQTIADFAFVVCQSLESIVIPDSVTTIGTDAFRNNYQLKTAVIGNGVTSIAANTFENCTRLSSLSLGSSVRIIGNFAFRDCGELEDFSFPSGLTSIGEQAFKGCSSLETLVIPNLVSSLGVSAFQGCTSLREISIGNSLVIIPDNAFVDCKNLESVEMGLSVSSIGVVAFGNCEALLEIDLGFVTSIGYSAFYNCSSLESVILGPDLISLGIRAFANCGNLSTVRIDAMTPPALPAVNVFAANAPGRKFYVRYFEDHSIIGLYKTTGLWAEFADSFEEAVLPPSTNPLNTAFWGQTNNGTYDFCSLAFNSQGDLYAVFNSSTSSNRILGPLVEGADLSTAPVHATGGSDNPTMLVFDEDDTIYVSSDYSDVIYRVGPDGGALSSWVDIGGYSDYDPCWAGLIPAGFDSNKAENIMIVDRDSPNNSSNVFHLSTSNANYSFFYSSNGTPLSDAVAGAFSSDTLYIGDIGGSTKGLYAMHAGGGIEKLSTMPVRCIAVHPVTGKVYFGDNGPVMTLYCYDPSTGDIEWAGRILHVGTYSWRTMVFTPDGSALLVPAPNAILSVTGF